LKRDARDREVAQRARRLANEIRAADDPGRTWPTENLLDALVLPTPTRRALELHWAGNAVSVNRVSLRQLMDLVVAPSLPGRDYLIVPAFQIRGVGGVGFRALVAALQRLNLDGACREEWLRRFDLEARSWRIQGGENYFWSMPNPMQTRKGSP